ncbi:IS5 family transposase [uncultured Oceanisphaera sp.]|uniref:IS5 family transposase n=1 Tax=uncultured Oceanisphaera sp. TaxID=353858 RepID=UPI00261606AB|nr:IS5 family transposase [uncultured Oceanisphaera sp.]
MPRPVLSDDQWVRIKDLLPGKASDCGVTAKDNRLFVEAVLWMARTGAPWRDLPESFGHWHRVYVRYNRWSHKGVWTQIWEAVSDDPDLEYLMVDGSIVRVHQHGASKKQSAMQAQGKSRGGLSTKIHLAVDALGNPIRFLLTPGQASEYGQANQLIEGIKADFVMADKGYDSDSFVASIRASGASPELPPRKNLTSPRDYDKILYKERNLVERAFQKLKHYRRIATRYERVEKHYTAMLSFVSTVIWLA